MQISEPRLRTLLRQAGRVADQGKLAAAATLYRQILEEAPDSSEAWLGLAEVTGDRAEKEAAYQRVLALDPGNEAAELGLATLHKKPPAPEPEPIAEPAAAQEEDGGDTAVSPVSSVAEEIVQQHREMQALREAEPPEDFEMVCYRHPDRTTSLRCYTCDNPICVKCAVKTPVGYRCPDCIREAEEAFFTSKPLDYVIASLVALPLSLAAGFLVTRLGGSFIFFFIIFIAAGAAGTFIGRVTKGAIGRRRGRYLPQLVAFWVAFGVIVPALPAIVFLFIGGAGALFSLIGPGIYLFIAPGAAFYQMK